MSLPARADLAIVFPRAVSTGGVERVALDLLRYESARRSTVFVGEQIDDASLAHAAVQVGAVPESLRPLAFRRGAARALRELAPATTLTFGANCPPGDVYWVQSVHRAWLEDGGDVAYRGVRIPPAVRRMLLRHQVLLRVEREYFTHGRPRLMLCTSQREVDDLHRLYGVAREIMHVVPNGFDPDVFNAARRAEARGATRERIGARDDDIVVLMVANEWHRKGLGVLLEAVGALGDPRVRVDLVGVRSPEDYRPIAQRLGVRMQWHGASDDVAIFDAAADVFALPTTYEPFGMVIIEAMASGLPVVVSQLAGAAAAITPSHNGMLITNPRDPAEIASLLHPLLNQAERDRVGAAAAHSVDAYRWENVFARADELIFGRQD